MYTPVIPFYLLVRRLFTSLLVIVGLATLTFFVVRILPGDPAQLYVEPRVRPAQLAAVRTLLGLDRPLLAQFVGYVADLVRGDWGISFKTKRPVAEDLHVFLPATLELVLFGFVIAVSAGMVLGVISGAWQEGLLDRLGATVAILGASMPVFWLALLGQQLFFSQLQWLPLNGRLDADTTLTHPFLLLNGFLLR